jgi:hypothetical protein
MIDTIGSSLSALFVLFLSLFFISCGVAAMFGGRKVMSKVAAQYLKGSLMVVRFTLKLTLQLVENGARLLRSLL